MLMCQHCGGAKSRVAETREKHYGLLTRRRECEGCGKRYTTHEVNETVLRALGMKEVDKAIDSMTRGIDARAKARRTKAKVKEMIEAGEQPLKIAAKANITTARVRQIRKELEALCL